MSRVLLLASLPSLLFCCGCATTDPTATPEARAQTRATVSPLSTKKFVTRNNAASLLFQLVEEEKDVDILLHVKGHRADIASLVKAIAASATDASKQLQLLAQADPSLNLHSVDLPAGEVAARAAITKTKTHDLLLMTGDNFEFALLYSQAEALNYGASLAQTAVDNSDSPAQKQTFAGLHDTMKNQYDQIIALLRGPAK